MSKNKIIAGLAVLLVIASAGVVMVRHKKPAASQASASKVQTPTYAKAKPDSPLTNAVLIKDMKYAPDPLVIKVGTKVTWLNGDNVSHTVTADKSTDGFASPTLGVGEKYSYTFDKAGTYAYHCTIHSSMHGTVTVIN
ncbi:MAG: blue (type 1) copper domain protein [Candidatus Saccharibacteria bacterium]|nr:blue (type 1) copper domain protein [Candidatus Saccharibacteria bacterium]